MHELKRVHKIRMSISQFNPSPQLSIIIIIFFLVSYHILLEQLLTFSGTLIGFVP